MAETTPQSVANKQVSNRLEQTNQATGQQPQEEMSMKRTISDMPAQEISQEDITAAENYIKDNNINANDALESINKTMMKSGQLGEVPSAFDLAAQMEHFDCLVVDSFQALTSKKKMNTRALERYAVSTLTRAAKDNECTLFFIMHLTKDGKLKGSTLVPHTVDVNMNIEVDADTGDDARRIFFTKNRFGPLNELTMFIGAKGYDFSAPIVVEASNNKAKSKKSKKQDMLDKIIAIKEPPALDAKRVMKTLDVDYQKAYNLLRELVLNDKLVKFGKGQKATYKHSI